MGGFAGAPLAMAVSKAGGLGQIGAVEDVEDLASQLGQVERSMDRQNGVLPIGVGLLAFILEVENVLPVLQKFKPAVVWIFAARELADYAVWAEGVRNATPGSQVWIQVGSVEAALTVARDARPDAIVTQGIDAGGHGFEQGAGIVSLLPEAADALAEAGHGRIPLVAAGGIAEGRSAAAAFALGAQGVVMGTRFLSASETTLHPQYRAAILAAHDGGQQTVRAKVFDELRGPNPWPESYDGRSIRGESFRDHMDGVAIDEIRRRYAEAVHEEGGGFGPDAKGRAATWAGTGVGLVKKEQAAADIVDDVRKGIAAAMEAAKARL